MLLPASLRPLLRRLRLGLRGAAPALAGGFFAAASSADRPRLARLSLSASIRSITWARGAAASATRDLLALDLLVDHRRARGGGTRRCSCSGLNVSLARPLMSCSARSSSPALILRRSPLSTSSKFAHLVGEVHRVQHQPVLGGRMSTRLSLPRIDVLGERDPPAFSIASASRR